VIYKGFFNTLVNTVDLGTLQSFSRLDLKTRHGKDWCKRFWTISGHVTSWKLCGMAFRMEYFCSSSIVILDGEVRALCGIALLLRSTLFFLSTSATENVRIGQWLTSVTPSFERPKLPFFVT
jgi:hypothetical protein